MPRTTAAPNKELEELQRRFKRGYRLERAKSGYYHVLNGDGGPVKHKGRIVRISGTPRGHGYGATITALEAAGVLKPLDAKAAKPRRSSANKTSITAETAATLQAARDRNRQQEVDALHDRLDAALKSVGGLHLPGMQADLVEIAALFAREQGLTASTPDLLQNTISRIAQRNWVVYRHADLFALIAEKLEASEQPNIEFFHLLRQAKGLPLEITVGGTGKQLELALGRWPFTVEEIAIPDMFVDHTYQRPVPWPFVRKMAVEFDPAKVGTIDVSARGRGATHAIMDGQCRWEAARRVGMETMWCAVYHEFAIADEARFFLAKNRDRKAVHPYWTFRAKVTSGDPGALELEAIVSRTGYKIATHSAKLSDERNISAIYALEEAYHRGSLEATLKTMRPTRGLPQANAASLLRGLSRLFQLFPDAEIGRVSELLMKRSPHWYVEYSRQNSHGGSGIQGTMVRQFIADYNRRFDGDKLQLP